MESHQLHTKHERLYGANRFVYPVLSRRSQGISIGVNLNPDRVCNFGCIYCQVDRVSDLEGASFVETDQLLTELRKTLAWAASGEIFESRKFAETPRALRRINDIAFSGDGEPTTFQNFDQVVASCAEVKQQLGLESVKMVLITNASMFHRPHVMRGIEILDQNRGEIWAKLDAGTEAYFQLINRTRFSLEHTVSNITSVARDRSVVIQTLFMNVRGERPSREEIDAYCVQLNTIVAAGGKIDLVQIYTIAREVAEAYATLLSDADVDEIVQYVRSQTGLEVRGFYGAAVN